MATEVIHKLNISPEAAFDITECLGLADFNKRAFKSEVEEYIKLMTASGGLPWWGYFRCDYLDEGSGRRLKLFVYKGMRVGLMQYWDLAGVCEAEDWTQDAEDEGLVRAWLKHKITDLPGADDWAVNARVNQILNETEKTLWKNVLEEVVNGFECIGDKKLAEKLFLLQGTYFGYYGRRKRKKKAIRN